MATKAFQKIYTKITQITKATCSLKATGVGYDELATVDGKLAQVVKIAGDDVTLQVFEGTEGIPTNAEVVFLGKSPTLKVSEQLAGRFFNAFGDPIDGGPEIEGQEVEIGGPSVNPVRRKQPSELIATGIAGIDLARRSFFGTPATFRPYSTLPMVVNQGKRQMFWNTTPRSGPGPFTVFPFTITCPLVTVSRPAIRLIMVLLPHWPGPNRATNSCSLAVKLKSPITWNGPEGVWKVLLTFLHSIMFRSCSTDIAQPPPF